MSDDPTPRIPKPLAIGGGMTFLYVAIAVVFAGASIFLVVVRREPVASASVLVAALGALWFAGRAAVKLWRKR